MAKACVEEGGGGRLLIDPRASVILLVEGSRVLRAEKGPLNHQLVLKEGFLYRYSFGYSF